METIYLFSFSLVAFFILKWYLRKFGTETFTPDGINFAVWIWLLLICFSLFALDVLYQSVWLIQDGQFLRVAFCNNDTFPSWYVVRGLLCNITATVPKYADPLLHYFLFPAVLLVVSIYSVRNLLKITEKKINFNPKTNGPINRRY